MAISFTVPVSAPSGSPFARSVGLTAALRSASVIATAAAAAGAAAMAGAAGAGVCARMISPRAKHNIVTTASTIFFVMGLLTSIENRSPGFMPSSSLPDPALLIRGSDQAHDADQTDQNPHEDYGHPSTGAAGDAQTDERNDKSQ